MVWFREEGTILGFQLCYDRRGVERAITWFEGKGYAHHQVDDGEGHPLSFKRTPILIQDQEVALQRILQKFRLEVEMLPSAVLGFVGAHLASCAAKSLVADIGSSCMLPGDLSIERDFLLRGMPWDLSRPRFMDFQREHIGDKARSDPSFPANLRLVALESLENERPEVVRRGLVALTFVGMREDLPIVEKLAMHSDVDISRDARTCLFEMSKRHR